MTLADLRTATMNARTRTRTPTLGTEVRAGQFRVTVQCKEGRRVSVIPASDWLSGVAVVDYLNTLQDLSASMARAAIARI